uniref:Putative sensor protein n=1 Tax=Aeromonas hydrophila TaxID=644 RepID=Q5YL06_AERHY|nr:putative sensor protein [Aeromonas hydrophila]
MMLLAVFERAALMLMTLFFLTRTRPFQRLFQKRDHTPAELVLVAAIFCLFAVFSTYTGIPVEGALINVRIIAIISGGILFGPWVGIPAGVISGLHRYLIDMDGHTSIPCLIASIIAGLLATWLHLRCRKSRLWLYGILAGMACEGLTMLLIWQLTEPHAVGVEIVSHIAYPMIAGALCIGLIIKLVQDLDDEKELIAAKQAKLALDIANKTLPFFQNIDRHSLSQVCGIIRSEISADAVAITDTRDVLAYVGVGKDYYELDEHHAISAMTQRAVLLDQIIINNDLRQYHLSDFHSVIIIPLAGERRRQRHPQDLLPPHPQHHQFPQGDGGGPLPAHLHPDGGVAHRATERDDPQGGVHRAAEQDQPALPVQRPQCHLVADPHSAPAGAPAHRQSGGLPALQPQQGGHPHRHPGRVAAGARLRGHRAGPLRRQAGGGVRGR